MFHPKCGERIKLSNGNRTATRSASEFNFGLVFSSEPLADEELFEIRIDKKIYSWIGSLEIGVTTCDPDTLNFPASATDLRNGSWILSGKSVLKDGRTLVETYPLNLDKIIEGEKIGMMRTANGELEFFVNGISHGIAAGNVPRRVFAVIDVYGKVSQVTIMPKRSVERCLAKGSSGAGETIAEECEEIPELVNQSDDMESSTSSQTQERQRFHERTGSLVKLSCGGHVAERMRPTDEFNNAVVMTHRPLQSDTLFEIRIDRLVEKWSGSIEVGVTTHNPGELEFPATMTNMRSGTVMMSGCGILTNGKGTKREYGDYNLDELRVGDRIGMMRKSNGDLHYFINGLDQGIAASHVPELVWGVVDLYGMTVKVTIVDRDEREEQNLITRRNTILRENALSAVAEPVDEEAEDRLLFHPSCGSHAAIINNGRTAHRPNALDDFNNAVVLTNRPLKINEVFEVRIDKMVTKWAGSIEIGVTTHAPTELEYPSTMTNVRSGTWIMTGNGVMHNGTSVIDDYGQNLDRLQTGDRVGVVIREGGSLHFLVNGEDQGEAGTGLPPRLHAVIDLYGQASQASIVSHCPSCSPPPLSQEIHFHGVHGRNARVTNGGRTASRPRASVEFNDAVVVTNRPLRPGEMFSVIVERIIDKWFGSIGAGVGAIRPDDWELPRTIMDLDHDTWMLSGFAVRRNGVTLQRSYPLDLDKVQVGSIVGLKRHLDGSLHYYLDGVDHGEACTGLPEQVYPVIALYGQCAQVSIVSTEPEVEDLNQMPSHTPSDSTVLPNQQQLLHKIWSEVGKWVTLDETETLAMRSVYSPIPGALLFSQSPLKSGCVFEIVIEHTALQWAGCISLGVTVAAPASPPQVPAALYTLKEPTWYISGSDVYHNGEVIRRGYCPSLQWLRAGNKLGIKRGRDGSLHLYIDGVDQGIAAHNIPKKVYAVVDLFGSVSGIKVTSKVDPTPEAPLAVLDAESPCDKILEGSSEEGKKSEDLEKSIEDGDLVWEMNELDLVEEVLTFHECHGRNIQVSESRLAARRVSSYNQGLVLISRPLPRGQLFQIRIESLNPRWVSSLIIGVTSMMALGSTLPVTALGLKKDTWVIAGDCVYHNGYMVKRRYGPNLETLGVGTLVAISVDEGNNLRLWVNGTDQGVAASNIPRHCLPVLDLYGMCDQVSLVNGSGETPGLPIGEGCSSDWSTGVEKGDTERGEKPPQAPPPLAPPDASRSKSDKMNENIQCSSAASPILDHPKAIASSENLTLQMQNAERRAEQNSSSNSFIKSPTVAVRSIGGSLAVTPVAPGPVKPTTCDYLSSVLRLKAYLGLPNGFFESGGVDCECPLCSIGRGPKEVNPSATTGGNGGGGWVKLSLKRRGLPPVVEGPAVGPEQWHVAFATIGLGQVRSVLDTGEIMTPDEQTIEQGLGKQWTDKKHDDCNTTQLVLSPTLSHATTSSSCPKYQFTDPKTKQCWAAYAAFQVVVRPGCYKVGCGQDDQAWVTKERNATQLAALLLKLEPV